MNQLHFLFPYVAGKEELQRYNHDNSYGSQGSGAVVCLECAMLEFNLYGLAYSAPSVVL